jgi:serine/threonine protein kinase
MWSLGCVVAELFLGWPLFPGSSEYDQIRYIIDARGSIPDQMLTKSTKVCKFFQTGANGFRVLKPAEVYEMENKVKTREARKYVFRDLIEMVEIGIPGDLTGNQLFAERADRHEFVDLIKRMLEIDPDSRCTPEEALAHPFLTMSHFHYFQFCANVISSWEHMQVCTQPTEPARRPLHVDITQCSCCDRGRHSHSTSLMSPSVPTAQFSQTAVPLKKSGHVMECGGGPIELIGRGVHHTADQSGMHQSASVLRPPPPLIQAAPHSATPGHFLPHPYRSLGPSQPKSVVLQSERHFPLLAQFRDGRYGEKQRSHYRETSGHTLHHHPQNHEPVACTEEGYVSASPSYFPGDCASEIAVTSESVPMQLQVKLLGCQHVTVGQLCMSLSRQVICSCKACRILSTRLIKSLFIATCYLIWCWSELQDRHQRFHSH